MSSSRIKVATIVGARPQFVKAAAVSRALNNFNDVQTSLKFDEHIIHTGQHYDDNMSKVFFEQLKIPQPRLNLNVGSGGHGKQTGIMLEKLEHTFTQLKPDWVLVYGDTNSTLAGALAAAKIHIPVAHVEAGLRSFNRRMPEEINRILTDQISDLLFCPTETAVQHLKREGINRNVHQVGDVMRDAFDFNLELATARSDIHSRLKLTRGEYSLVTVHRAESTDDPLVFKSIVDALLELGTQAEVLVFPAHPRIKGILAQQLSKAKSENVMVIEPVPYLDMLALEQGARVILTDSGGVQKEASWVGVPCVTLRNETEWVETVAAGHNRLAGTVSHEILQAYEWARNCGKFSAEATPNPRASTQIARLLALANS
jgi:UDP-GlcNAc3NAcA epimerase